MEPGSDLSFSISILNNEFTRLSALQRIVDRDTPIYQAIIKKIENIQGAILCLHGGDVKMNYEYSLGVLRSNIPWLERQADVIPASNEIIQEIENVTQLLKSKNEA